MCSAYQFSSLCSTRLCYVNLEKRVQVLLWIMRSQDLNAKMTKLLQISGYMR